MFIHLANARPSRLSPRRRKTPRRSRSASDTNGTAPPTSPSTSTANAKPGPGRRTIPASFSCPRTPPSCGRTGRRRHRYPRDEPLSGQEPEGEPPGSTRERRPGPDLPWPGRGRHHDDSRASPRVLLDAADDGARGAVFREVGSVAEVEADVGEGPLAEEDQVAHPSPVPTFAAPERRRPELVVAGRDQGSFHRPYRPRRAGDGVPELGDTGGVIAVPRLRGVPGAPRGGSRLSAGIARASGVA